jgi:hypothetical protein
MFCRHRLSAGCGSHESVEELEDVIGAVGQGVFDLATFVALEHQTCDDQTAQVFAGCAYFDLQSFANLTDAQFGTNSQQLEDLNAAMVGKPFDHSLQTLGTRAGSPDNASGCFHYWP